MASVRRCAERRASVFDLDDIKLENMAHGMVVRSHHAHARIKKINTSAAAQAPDVLAVFTGMDWKAEGLGDMPTRT